jgi:hypothetical protein
MFRKILKGAAIGGALLAIAGTAVAANYEINLYGASAQYLFWNDAADDFLKQTGTGKPNCAAANILQVQDADKKNGYTKTTAVCGDGNNYVIRYSAKASYDGICAVQGLTTAQEPNCATGCNGDQSKRLMCDESSADCSALKCVRVTLGASDVAAESFVQSTSGQKFGPNGGGSFNPSFDGIPIVKQVNTYKPLIVPFGFFAHNSVTGTKCLAPNPTTPTSGGVKAISNWGNQCYDADGNGKSADCIGYYQCVSNLCAGGTRSGQACDEVIDCPDVIEADTNCARMPIDNISRLMAAMIFSGQAVTWKDFGDWYEVTGDPSAALVACLRHAGSGTHATMDLAVMNGKWGATTATAEIAGQVYFNEGSSDLMKCVNQLTGAIGYADSDQLYATKAKTGSNFPYPNVVALKYQGIEPYRAKIRNGEYDFWSVQWIYENKEAPEYNTLHNTVVALMNYAKANVPSTKANYWATADEMVYMKGTDFQYPQYKGAATPKMP